MNHNRPGPGPLTVTVLVFPGVRLLDATGPIEVFASANEFGGRYRVLLETGGDSLPVVARRTGFGSAESLRRAFVRQLGVTPGAFRTSFRTTGTGTDTDLSTAVANTEQDTHA
ncbi:helix-turn-helix domain-containing protein [Streptomyces sp. NRRL F-525]|uniref:helix-turn-helix domain-containing protein n=1 Tax=Streptomyces sp. NRRL F-525 TaxID=1463861 RepID=UPI0005259502|nr:helix-turn-helix domain-containing protein [Streptomyces sp. NRRL F-525]